MKYREMPPTATYEHQYQTSCCLFASQSISIPHLVSYNDKVYFIELASGHTGTDGLQKAHYSPVSKLQECRDLSVIISIHLLLVGTNKHICKWWHVMKPSPSIMMAKLYEKCKILSKLAERVVLNEYIFNSKIS